jgi:hypothetical protein
VEEFIVYANLESAAAGRDQLRIYAGRFANESCQTGSFWFVVSGRAVFYRDLRWHALFLLSFNLSRHYSDVDELLRNALVAAAR